MNTENKKAFDPTNNFTFFGSWLKAMEALETEQDRKSNAYMFFKAIANYSMYDETPNFDTPALKALWSLVEKEIDISIGKRKNNFANDEMNEKYQSIINAVIANPSLSLREIGDITGTNKNMVDRVKRKYAQQINEAIANSVADEGIVNDCDSISENYTDSDYYIVNDTMGQDWDGTAGQFDFSDDDLPF